MSTKIYDAFILDKSIKTFDDLSKFNQNLKENIQKEAETKIAKDIARRIQLILDVYEFYGDSILKKKVNIDDKRKEAMGYIIEHKNDDPIPHLWFEEVYSHYPQMLKDLKPYACIHEVKIMYFACGRKILAMAFGDHSYFHHFYENELLKDYHYQNQTDRPEDISAREYSQRSKDWNKAIGPDYIPVNHGLEFELLTFDNTKLAMTLCRNKENIDNGFKLAKEDYQTRVRTIRETMKCPLFKDCKTIDDRWGIENSQEYNSWAQRQNKRIRKKMGFPEFCDK